LLGQVGGGVKVDHLHDYAASFLLLVDLDVVNVDRDPVTDRLGKQIPDCEPEFFSSSADSARLRFSEIYSGYAARFSKTEPVLS